MKRLALIGSVTSLGLITHRSSRCERNEVNVLVLGRTGTGKSSLINAVDPSAEAKTNSNLTSTTIQTRKYTSVHPTGYFWGTKIINFYDTPGISDIRPSKKLSDDEIYEELKRYIGSGDVIIDKIIFCMNENKLDGSQLNQLAERMKADVRNKHIVEIIYTRRDLETNSEREAIASNVFETLTLTREPCLGIIGDVYVVSLHPSSAYYGQSVKKIKKMLLDGKSINRPIYEIFKSHDHPVISKLFNATRK